MRIAICAVTVVAFASVHIAEKIRVRRSFARTKANHEGNK